MGASATLTMMSSHHTGTDPPSAMQPQHQPRGRPKKKRVAWKRSHAPSPSPPHVQLSEDGDSESDTSAQELWDPHASLKPSERDDCASDANIKMEDDLPPGGDKEVSTAMVKMMVDLEECEDGEWLPPRLRKKIKARKIGIISSA
jgi:hypothetical protein